MGRIGILDFYHRYTAKMASKLGFQNLRRLNQALSTVRQYSAGSGAYSEHAKSAAAWKNAFYFLGAPAVALVYINAFHILPQHPEREEFVAYPHLRIRNRAFPWWEDGQKTLFHNPYYNALPEGYEEGSEELHHGH